MSESIFGVGDGGLRKKGVRVGRRHTRLRLAIVVGAFVLALLPNFGAPAVASPRATGQIVANEVSQSWPTRGTGLTRDNGSQINAADAGSTGGETLLFSSATIDSGQLFDRLGVHWIAARGEETTVYIETRHSMDGSAWSDWDQVREEEDLTDEYTNEHYASPMPVGSARYAQYRVWLTNGNPDAISRMNLTFLDVDDLNAGPVARLFNDIAGAFTDFTRSYAAAATTGASKILTRADWAADETLMQWPPRYQKVQKFIVHHTVTDDGGTNVAAAIRSIYYFHAVTRGWGDIGYNYIVDKFGNIWTGRQGGDNTIAGHAYGWNNGSIGIAALGDYSVAAPTGALQGAIANLIAIKSSQFGIQPYGNDTFTHQEQAPDGSWVNIISNPTNVLGHRDCNYVLNQHGGQTACPGTGIYNMMDGLRRLAQAAVTDGYFDMPYIEPQLPKAGFPGAVLQVPVMVTNRGRLPIPQGTSVSYRLLKNGGVALAQGASATLPNALAPGASMTVSVTFPVPALGSYVARWDLQTSGAWWNTIKGTPVRDMWFNAADWSADWVKDNVPISWVAGETRLITVTVQNDGGRTWPATGTNPVQLGYKWVSNSTGNTFPGPARVGLAADVPPGGTAILTIPVVAPVYPTNYTMYLDLYKQNEFAFADKGVAPDDTPTGVSVDFKATYAVQSVPAFNAGQVSTVPVLITNTGNGVFPVTNSYPINLGYHWTSMTGQNVVWDGVRTKLPADLQPGQSAMVAAQVTAPPQGGQYQLRFDLVQEGVTWFSGRAVQTGTITTQVAGPLVKAYGATYSPTVPAVAASGTTTTIPVVVTNTSNFSWPAAGAFPIDLSYHWMDPSGATVVWDGLRTKLAADILPGGTATLQARVQYPAGTATYTLRFDMVEEGVSWFSGKDVRTFDRAVSVAPAAVPFFGGSLDVSGTPATFATSATTLYNVKIQNLSNFDWDPAINLSYHVYDASGRVLVWDGLRTSLSGIKKNELRTIGVKVQAPVTAGSYTLRYDIVQEGVTWFSSQGMQTPARAFTAQVAGYAATYTPSAPQSSGPAGSRITVPVTVANVGSLVWQPGVVNISYHLMTASGFVFVWDGVRTPIPQPLGQGQSATVNLAIQLPATPGTYEVRIDAVQEGVTWFSGQSIAPGTISLQVQ
jgi:hypothetical protein